MRPQPPSLHARPVCAFALSLALSAMPSLATAQPETAQPATAQPATADGDQSSHSATDLKELRVAMSVAGAVQGSFITKPDSEYYKAIWGEPDVPYSGYGGVGGAAALSLEVAWKVLGLSVGYTHSLDAAKGKIDGQSLSLSQTTHHIPLTLRAELPSALVRPSLFGGVDWVSASSTELKAYPGSLYTSARAEDYRAWIFGIGFDFMLTSTLRLPVRLYGVFNPTTRATLNDAISPRFEFTSPSSFGTFELKSEWIWQAGISVGVSFDVYQR